MGTTYSVKWVSSDLGGLEVKSEALKQEVESVLKEINRQMSTYIKDSEISKLNLKYQEGGVEISSWFAEVLRFSLQLAQQTNGAFDPTLGPWINLWGFGPNGEKRIPSAQKISKVRPLVGFEKVSLKMNGEVVKVLKSEAKTYVDLSATAKGFGVDRLSTLLNEKGLKDHLIEIGGEIRASGSKLGEVWKVGIEAPESDGRGLHKVVQLKDLAVATSGSYRNFFESKGKKYSHMIDFRTGKPVEHGMVSATVLHKNCMEADGWATALMALGPEKSMQIAEKYGIAAYMISVDENDKIKTQQTSGFQKLVQEKN